MAGVGQQEGGQPRHHGRAPEHEGGEGGVVVPPQQTHPGRQHPAQPGNHGSNGSQNKLKTPCKCVCVFLGLTGSYLALVMLYLAMKDALPMPELRSSVGRSSAV